MSILFMFSYNPFTALLCLETSKIHINNTSVGSQKYIWKCQFTFICTLHWRSKRPEAIERARLKCYLQFSLPLSFQKPKLLLFSHVVGLWICLCLELWASYLWLFLSFVICLACSVWLQKLEHASSVEQLQELLNIMNTIPQHIWQCATRHKLVTSLYEGGPQGIIRNVPKEYLPMTSAKKNSSNETGTTEKHAEWKQRSSFNKPFQWLGC